MLHVCVLVFLHMFCTHNSTVDIFQLVADNAAASIVGMPSNYTATTIERHYTGHVDSDKARPSPAR